MSNRGLYFCIFGFVIMSILAGCDGMMDGMYSEKGTKVANEKAKKFEPDSKDGIIYIYRNWSGGIVPRALFFYRSGTKIASLKGESFVRVKVEPGDQYIGVKSPSSSSLDNKLKIFVGKGGIVYLNVDYENGTPVIKHVNQDKAQKKIRNYELLLHDLL